MTPYEINRAIAESLGWDWYAVEKAQWYYREGGHGYTNRIQEAGRYTKDQASGLLVRGEPMAIVQIPPPNYYGDLNAIQEAVETLEDQCAFLRELQIVTQEWTHVDENGDDMWLWYSVNATAPQRCEAYLRTMNLWREE